MPQLEIEEPIFIVEKYIASKSIIMFDNSSVYDLIARLPAKGTSM